VAKYALLVGVDDYAPDVPLPPCTPLAALDPLREVLQSSCSRFEYVRTLFNPDRAQLTRALLDWSAAGRRGDLLLLYVAGAGALDAAGRAHVLLPGYNGTLRPPHALSLANIMNNARLSVCTRRVVLLDMGFTAAGSASGNQVVLAQERMRIADTAVLASAAGAPFVADRGAMPSRRLLGPWLTERLTAAAQGVVTVGDVYQWLRQDTAPDERVDVPRLWLSHMERGGLVLARHPAAPQGAESAERACSNMAAPRITRGVARASCADVRTQPSARRARRSLGPVRSRRRADHRHYGRLGALLRLPLRLLGLALLGPLALFMAGEDTSRDVQVAALKVLHQAAPGVFNRVFVDGQVTLFSDSLRSGGRGPELAALPGGFFQMGSAAGEPERHAGEGPVHRMGVEPFALGIAEVSFAEYDRFARATGRPLPPDNGWGRGNRPVINVSWDDAVAYVRWLSAETGKRYFLPTEAQWEYAARAGTTTPFATGGCIHTEQANYNGVFDYADCGARTGIFRGQTLPATVLPPNPWGLYHMNGNVWEWVHDCWHPAYGQVPKVAARAEDAALLSSRGCGRRVIRGGGWRFEPGYLRSATRLWSEPGTRNSDIGFRIARALD